MKESSTLFESTRATPHTQGVPVTDAIFQGLAADGGLYVPQAYGNIMPLISSLPKDIGFQEFSAYIMHELFKDDFSIQEAQDICARAFDFAPSISQLDERTFLLELYHGPTCAFKDFGAHFLSTLMEKALQGTQQHITIITATSGDTGAAVAQAFYQKSHINVVILYPSKRVSPLQEKQLTTLGGNIQALEVDGTFDDCQRLVKAAFQDPSLRSQYNLSSANSINIGRLIPQSFYYMYAWFEMHHKHSARNFVFCVPSGNFGNLTAGMLAKQWNMPFTHFIAACNANDVVPHYLDKGTFHPKKSIDTLANAMDVGDPSNFERMIHMCKEMVRSHQEPSAHEVHAVMQGIVESLSVSDEQIREEIKKVYESQKKFLCPHTAVGTYAATQILASDFAKSYGYESSVVLSTADPGKFSEVIVDTCGVAPPIPHRIEKVLSKEKKSIPISPHLEEVKNALQKTVS